MRPKLRRFGCRCPARFRFMCLRADSTPALMQGACQHLCWAEEWRARATLMPMPVRVAEREKSLRESAAPPSAPRHVVLAKHRDVDSWPRCCRSETTRESCRDQARYRACAMCRLCRRDRTTKDRLATQRRFGHRGHRGHRESENRVSTLPKSTLHFLCVLGELGGQKAFLPQARKPKMQQCASCLRAAGFSFASARGSCS
jgi:hypothetical protein